MESFKNYCERFVLRTDLGVACVCLLCPATVNAQRASFMDEQLRLHFEKHHVAKPGFLYCNVCYKSICTIGQKEQLAVHEQHPSHISKKERRGRKFACCMTCGCVNPAAGHNTKHTIERQPYVCDAGEGIDIVDKASKAAFAEAISMLATKKEGDLIAIGSWCNEHFEKMFRVDHTMTPIETVVGGSVSCGVCTRMSKIWPQVEIRKGRKLFYSEEQIRPYVIPMLKRQPELAAEITPAEFADLADHLQEMYIWERKARKFVLDVQAAKRQVVKEFLHSGASGDSTDSSQPPLLVCEGEEEVDETLG